jgi:hypothetical protein
LLRTSHHSSTATLIGASVERGAFLGFLELRPFADGESVVVGEEAATAMLEVSLVCNARSIFGAIFGKALFTGAGMGIYKRLRATDYKSPVKEDFYAS